MPSMICAHGRSVCMPCASSLKKFPQRPMAWRERNRYRDQISSAHEALFVTLADKIADQEAENQAAMDSQTAAADIIKFFSSLPRSHSS